jgi:hypothetical protein
VTEGIATFLNWVGDRRAEESAGHLIELRPMTKAQPDAAAERKRQRACLSLSGSVILTRQFLWLDYVYCSYVLARESLTSEPLN